MPNNHPTLIHPETHLSYDLYDKYTIMLVTFGEGDFGLGQTRELPPKEYIMLRIYSLQPIDIVLIRSIIQITKAREWYHRPSDGWEHASRNYNPEECKSTPRIVKLRSLREGNNDKG